MEKKLFKNIPFAENVQLESLVSYQEGQVVSRTLAQNEAVSITLFAFDQNEEIGTHASGGDAFVYILDGYSEITIGGAKYSVSEGESIVMPANVPHSLYATERFKMLLVVLFDK